MNKTEFRTALAGLPLEEIRFYQSIPSTNDEALKLIEEGLRTSVLLFAEEQTAGRGRLNRRWITLPESALAFSLILFPDESEIRFLSQFSFLGALAVSIALQKVCGLSPQVKWPNDVLINRKKCCGILVESSSLGSLVQGVVIGIGLNIGKGSLPPAGEMLFPPACVEEELGRPVDRFAVLRQILIEIFHWRSRLPSPEFLQEYSRRLAFLGESVEIRQKGSPPVTGIVRGVDENGRLTLNLPDGRVQAISTGDLHLRPAI